MTPLDLFREHEPLALQVTRTHLHKFRGTFDEFELHTYALEGLWKACLKSENARDSDDFRAFAFSTITWAVLGATRLFRRPEHRIADRSEHVDIDDQWSLASAGTPESLLGEVDVSRALAVLIERLPAEQREIVRRHYFDDEVFRRIAESMDITAWWACRLHRRALETLAALVPEEWREANTHQEFTSALHSGIVDTSNA